MSKVEQKERITQIRILALLRDNNKLDYNYFGNWEERDDNSITEEDELRKYLVNSGNYCEELIAKSIFAFKN